MSPNPPTSYDQWPINSYWVQSEQKISQHWYISFCLMMSAVQDYLTGYFLYEKDNLNWATTCYYYSMVHTGRLIVFCTVGDFPKGHRDLRNLYNNGRVKLDWLNKFIRGGVTQKNLQRLETNDFYTAVVRLCGESETSRDPDEQIRSFSQQLSGLGDLRTDANYESLIIAHEKEHRLVTDGFTRLVSAASTAASEAVSLVIRSYKAYVNTSPLLNSRRDGFKLISDQYVAGRLYTALVEKVGTSNEVKESLESLCKSLTFDILESLEHSEHAEQIEQLIKLEQFDSKQSLMSQFLEKIEALEHDMRIRAEE